MDLRRGLLWLSLLGVSGLHLLGNRPAVSIGLLVLILAGSVVMFWPGKRRSSKDHTSVSTSDSTTGRRDQAMEGIAQDLSDPGGREIKTLGDGVHRMCGESAGLVPVVEEMAAAATLTAGKFDVVKCVLEGLSSNVQAMAMKIRGTTESLSLLAKASEQMTGAITEIAQNTEKAAVVTNRAVGEAAKATGKVRDLEAAAREINKVTDTITDISDRTNLLALNATIEAARAGESGRGFAVVAHEIKNLANQAGRATDEIRGKIEAIQGTTSETIAEIEKICGVIDEVNSIVAVIAAATEQQSTTSHDMAQNVAQSAEGIAEINKKVAVSSGMTQDVLLEVNGASQLSQSLADKSGYVNQTIKGLSVLASQLEHIVQKGSSHQGDVLSIDSQ